MVKGSWDQLWVGANFATMAGDDLGVIEKGAMATQGRRIIWIGPEKDLPGEADELAKTVYRLNGGWILPGFIDCHTHIVFGGNRANEFEMRLEGKTYEEIARAGGGIVSTVKATRSASKEALLKAAKERVAELLREGVTTIEIKSGYGLDLETEIKMLEVAREIARVLPIRVSTTFLGAHALPPEFAGRADDYIDEVADVMIPEIAKRGLADAVDGFCESIGFSRDQMERVFKAAKDTELPVKLHAEQLSDLGGATLAAQYGALSADHLEYLSGDGAKAMAKVGTVATLLPGAFYALKETQKPPVDLLRERQVPMALATDANPGSSPISSLLLILNMACTLFGLTPKEALAGVTRNGAKALGREKDIGSLELGKCADFAHWKIDTPAELCYWMGRRKPTMVVTNGQVRTYL